MIPDAAIRAAAEEAESFLPGYTLDNLARAAIEAAMPAIREAIAQEVEAMQPCEDVGWTFSAAQREAARIVRGGTP